MSRLSELVAKRESILDIFKQKAEELNNLTAEITNEVAQNTEVITTLTKENTALNDLKAATKNSINALNKILK